MIRLFGKRRERKEDIMFIIAGLGNPGAKYEKTRHNAGFDTLDVIAGKYGITIDRKHGKSLTGTGYIEGQKVLLCKPQTFMNLSGDAIAELTGYYRLDPCSQIIVIYDDINLEPGQLRIRKKGSAGGHNGIKDIIAKLGTDQFMRIRIGVGEKPAQWDLVDYVLGRMSPEDRKLMESASADASAAVALMVAGGADEAMNRYNRKRTLE